MVEISTPRGEIIQFKTDSGTIETVIKWADNLQDKLNEKYAKGGKVQAFVDQEYMRLVEPYWPLKTGVLLASMALGTVIGSGLIRVIAPYARQQFYEGRLLGKSQTGALRGRLPHDRCMSDNFSVLQNNIQEFIKKC